MKYTGNYCPVCEHKFTDDDEIVVCPDCGTPYHRACWQKVGVCMHTSEHKSGFEWKPDLKNDMNAQEGETVCSACGAHNPAHAQFCNQCGARLGEASGQNNTRAKDSSPIYSRTPNAEPGPHIEAFTTGANGIYRRELGPNDTIDGIKTKDWATYLGKNSMFYLMQFFRMSETKRKMSLCLSAFLFGPAYFFYRKMWKEGVLLTILRLLLLIPSLLYYFQLADIAFARSISTDALLSLANVTAFLSWGVQIFTALFAIYAYKQHATEAIKAISAQMQDENTRADALALSGGTSMVAAIVFVLAYVLFYLTVGLMIGPALLTEIAQASF